MEIEGQGEKSEITMKSLRVDFFARRQFLSILNIRTCFLINIVFLVRTILHCDDT